MVSAISRRVHSVGVRMVFLRLATLLNVEQHQRVRDTAVGMMWVDVQKTTQALKVR